MAKLSLIYAEVDRIVNVVGDISAENWDCETDLGAQAERLEIVAELAERNAALLRAADAALGGKKAKA